MKRTSTLILLILFAMLVSGCSTVSTHGQYTLHRGETLRGNLVLTSGQATLEEDSRVTGSVFMTSGSLDVKADAEIEGNVFLTSGNVYLGPRAVVRGDVTVTSGNVRRSEGARVEGKISRNGFDVGASLFGTFCLPPIVLLAVFLYWLIAQARKRPAAETQTTRTSGLVAGVVLILVGTLILIDNWAGLHLNWWAICILIPPASLLANAWKVYQAEGRLTAAVRGPLVGGVALLLVAGIFIFDLSWVTLWPLFLIIVGVGVLMTR
jgi:predicted small secreted protein